MHLVRHSVSSRRDSETTPAARETAAGIRTPGSHFLATSACIALCTRRKTSAFSEKEGLGGREGGSLISRWVRARTGTVREVVVGSKSE
jgi:hypothetical protein